jgi:hypothetical protein
MSTLACSTIYAQYNVGINTDTPERILDVQGPDEQYLRILSTGPWTTKAGLELTRDGFGGDQTDWRITNSGALRFLTSIDNFATSGTERMRISPSGNIGIGTIFPRAKMHIAFGEDASYTDDGYLMLGTKSSHNVIFDNNEMMARHNGSSSPLHIQADGGNTILNKDAGLVGVGTSSPSTKLNVIGTEAASLDGDGAFMIGPKASANIVMDANDIQARSNGSEASIRIQHGGGNAYIGGNGGNVYLAYGGDGNVGIGSSGGTGKLNVTHDNFQLNLRNTSNLSNQWYIGASNGSWGVGDDRLIFSPTNSTGGRVLTLMDVNDNNGSIAPVSITNGSHEMLLDGNEIDTKSPLYINWNTDENTIINGSGGFVGVGTSSPGAALQVEAEEGDMNLALTKGWRTWTINSTTNTNGDLVFGASGLGLAKVSGTTGAWLILSDRRFKENIRPLPSVLDKVERIGTYSYNYTHDKNKQSSIGVVAQELNELFPELVEEDEYSLKVSYQQLSVIAIKALQELSVNHSQLELKVASLEARLSALEN